MDRARDHAVKGDFEKAFEENSKAYDALPVELKQVAIFQKALLHGHPDNMDQNYEKAMVCFELVDENPDEKIFEYNSVLIFSSLKGSCDLAQKVSSSQQDILKGKKIMETRQNKIQALLEEQVKLKKYIARLKDQINQLKEVDLNSKGESKGIIK
ncbi:MAG: hypothetical protein KKE62_12390 [Proteobacteria bacterium]|nr:hypothetical protein [Pseudomonadota bacterium]MBU1389077.1 hypothetical protein [Pseudomonadota bacterium]MBU1543630.1 hypothetical protein [Pseudomonadota bacterium]